MTSLAVGESVVYYLWLPNRRAVKIGTTIVLTARLSAHRREMNEQVSVLALERGGPEVERARHRQWAAERCPWTLGSGTELFDPSPGLLAFVDGQRSRWVADRPADATRLGWASVVPRRLPSLPALLGFP